MIPTFLRTAGLAIMAALMLSGCSDSTVKMCPDAAILGDTATYTQFRNSDRVDPAGALFTARLVGVQTDCFFDKGPGQTKSTLALSFRATRKPVAEAASYDIPYFVAVTQADRILGKRSFTVHFSFAPGAAAANFTDTVDSTVIQLQNGLLPYDYQILTGFQLTQAQIDYNRKMGPFRP